MATGDQNDVTNRLAATLPVRWFPDLSSAPVLNSLLQGYAWAGSFAYGLIAFARQQTRIATASGGWLDMIAGDFFGVRVARRPGQSDTAFRSRIQAEMFRERATRNGLISVLTALTGRAPTVFEPWRPADTGGYDVGGVGYDTAGGWGSLALNNQAFVTAYRPVGVGIPYAAGYDTSVGGYDTSARLEYVSDDMVAAAIPDSDIYSAIDATKPAGSIVWVRIQT